MPFSNPLTLQEYMNGTQLMFSKQLQCLVLRPGEVLECPRKNRGHQRVPGQDYLIKTGHSNIFLGSKDSAPAEKYCVFNNIRNNVSIPKYQVLKYRKLFKVDTIHPNSSLYVCVLESTHFEFAAFFRRALKIVAEAESLFTGQCLLLSRDQIQSLALQQ